VHYKVVIFGVKDTTKSMVKYISENICSIDLIVTIDENVQLANNISGFSSLSVLADKYEISVYEADSYALTSKSCKDFFIHNTFDIGISIGWQRLIPEYVLNCFTYGVFGFHGSSGYLPYGRGRSPMNWSIIKGDTRFILNLFQYDALADSPNIFDRTMFEINLHDTIRTLHYKNILCAKKMIKHLIVSYQSGSIDIQKDSKDFDSWYYKRTIEDGKIDFHLKTREIYNLIRGVSAPFPGAFAYLNGEKIIIWQAYPFDSVLDFSEYIPGEVIDVFEGNLLIRTIDGSLIITKYECRVEILPGKILD
jgi:methionyl-tRNA formyltransferase